MTLLPTYDEPEIFKVYLDPAEIGLDGYPYAWHRIVRGTWPDGTIQWGTPNRPPVTEWRGWESLETDALGGLKGLVRDRDGHRCLRCGHPYRKGEHGDGRWSPCDERCTHGGPTRDHYPPGGLAHNEGPEGLIEAEWRVLTVHHLNGVKHDCRWWNLVSLCQRCHLSVQTRVVMERTWDKPHSLWFRIFAAAYYAWAHHGEELTIMETAARVDELLALEQRQDALPL